MKAPAILRHPLSPLSSRSLQAILAILIIMTVGTVGVKLLTGWQWIDSFYFMSMVATAQGPPNSPPTFWGKIFVSVMAFVSIGALVTTIGVLFGPALGYLFHKGITYAEKEQAKLKQEKTIEDDKEDL